MAPRRGNAGGRASAARGVLRITSGPTPVSSAYTTPGSSAYPSTYASEAEADSYAEDLAKGIGALTLDVPIANAPKKKREKIKPFPFLLLPSELRVKVYQHFFEDTPKVLDLDPDNYKRIHKKLGILRVCRTIYAEATHIFYSARTVRIFPCHPGRFFKTKKPLLARLTPAQRSSITTLELRLGPGWNRPPRGWVVNNMLGLKDCISVTQLNVFVECDPGDSVFNGFRRADGFYEGFTQALLEGVLKELPWVRRVEFDAWSSVKKAGGMMQGLLQIALSTGKLLAWGPERGWTDSEEEPTATNLGDATIFIEPSNQSVIVVA